MVACAGTCVKYQGMPKRAAGAPEPASGKLLLTISGLPMRVLCVRCHWQQRGKLPGSDPRRGLCAARFVTPQISGLMQPARPSKLQELFAPIRQAQGRQGQRGRPHDSAAGSGQLSPDPAAEDGLFALGINRNRFHADPVDRRGFEFAVKRRRAIFNFDAAIGQSSGKRTDRRKN